MNQFSELRHLNFPHINPDFKQKKELKFVFCYNFRFNGDGNPKENQELKQYILVYFC